MKLKYTLAALAATTLAANAAIVSASYGDLIEGVDDANQASGQTGQSAVLVDAASTVYLTDMSFQSSQTSVSNLAGGYLHVYSTSTFDGGSLVTVSNFSDFTAVGTGSGIEIGDQGIYTWTFGGTAADAVSTGTEYWYVVANSTTAGDISAPWGAALDTGNPYTAGDATGSNSTWDLEFELNANTEQVPEPSSAALLGLGGLALILRRRK